MIFELVCERPPLIKKDFGHELSDYLRFRHLKRNIYRFMPDWDKIEPLVKKIPQITEKMRSSTQIFFKLLTEITNNY
ncbi:hypothetical protein HX99_01775 [Peptococcaceae bacterium SCADC1_2_3]|jgi:hypothetical protein|nr:hypothetical protein DK28_0203365 [Peptococcaceae bacterium SCADC1_2_3]KFI35838.1 hypothetical protein HY00_00785 [Peptococcaceae bacterium SCADC1_2_3]KFI36739.1 hypothetical protein HX99_01775 [Peptococcaceae bacterium SCADC1_2_3]KFI37486.1 hypothetical protein HY02_06330 [Peptococcaceae bacterium SCADC1_2_3]HBQ28646.1 hypothetical protein [Desulfotomaculum sp.]